MAGMCASAISAAEEKKVENKKVNYQTYAAELDKTAYSGSDLGAVWSEDSTTFKVWAPKAATVKLNLYEHGSDEEGDGGSIATKTMELDKKTGVWSIKVSGNLAGKYYTYSVKNGDTVTETGDVYAKACGVNGKRSMVVNLNSTNPDGWENDVHVTVSNPTEASVWEVSVADFSSSESSGVSKSNRGKFLAFTEEGTTVNGIQGGTPTCVDYLKKLGVKYVQIMPFCDFGSVDESKDIMSQYNWGYDPVNYNCPEGSYSTNPYDGNVRIKECKQMIQALHNAGIGVIMDVVYNHTYSTDSVFQNTVPNYYYRMNEDGTFSNGSGCGNDTASEHKMFRKYMIDSITYWAKEYHIDGFRFDLMGVHDIETMNEIRKAVNKVDPTICIYGEGWAADTPQYPADSLAMKGNVSHMPGIAVFSDELRDGLCGPVWKKEKGAFLAGVPGAEMSVKFGIVAAIEHPQVRCDSVNYSQKPWAEQPTQMISYVSCHDGLCLVDRLKASMPGATPEQLVRLDKLAQTVVFTSQGIPFIYAGEEVMRDKQGVDNSYKSPDAVNAIDWRRKTTNGDVFMYYKRLIDLRKSHPAFRMGDAERVRKHLEFLPVEGQNLIAFRLKDHANGDSWEDIIVAFNSRMTPARLEVPVGKYTVVCKDGVIDVRGLGTQTGSEVIIPGQSALIMYK